MKTELPGEISIPDSDGEMPSPAAKRGVAVKDDHPQKCRRESTVTEGMLKRLLEAQTEKLMAAQSEAIVVAVQQLERKQEVKLGKIVDKLESHDGRFKELEDRLTACEAQRVQTSATGSTGDLDLRRKTTLLLGGWSRDTRRAVILQDVSAFFSKLQINDSLLDGDAFVTGPRRNTALLPFKLRSGEGLSEVRRRMHAVIQKVSAADIKIKPEGKRFFATYSKSPAEREKGAHCGLVKDVARKLGTDVLESLDCDYTSGAVWLGDSRIADASLPPPAAGGPFHFVSGKFSKPWVDLALFASEAGVDLTKMQALFQDGNH